MIYALETAGLCRTFGGLAATNDVSLRVPPGARHALIGPNGAGKTTLINLLSGTLTPTAGRVLLLGEDVTRRPQHQRVKRGLARTFQINRLFADLTVLQSVTLAVMERRGRGWRWWSRVGAEAASIDIAAALLDRLGLLELAHDRTGSLAYGKQRLIEIALALAAEPRVLLLDEPAAGVPRGESRQLFDTLAQLPPDMTILLIEHDMDLVFRFAAQITVLVHGAILAEGTPEAMAADSRVRDVYLGRPAHG